MQSGKAMFVQPSDLSELLAGVLPAVVAILDRGKGLGAGFVWKQEGLILTNSHVARRKKLEISFSNGRSEEAIVLARDADIDLAVLKISPADVPPLQTADFSQLRPGQLAIAVGHPFGQRNHLTIGVLSAIGQARINEKSDNGFPVIRTDLVLLPGNSGGPLLDARGRVLGVNTMVVGGDQGFAVPAYLADRLLEPVVDGHARRRV